MKLDKAPIKFNLQFFAEGGEADGAQEANQTANEEVGNVLPQAEVDKLIAQNKNKGKSEGQKELLKSLGYDKVDDLKAVLNTVKEAEEANKSDLEKANEQLESKNTTISELENTVKTLQATNAALGFGVKADSVDDVIALATRQVDEETDIDQAIKNVIEKYPNFSETAEVEGNGEQKKPSIFTGGNPASGGKESDAFNEAFGKFK
ncbi:hypothetical protein [Aerococcus viridans]|uniref:hypothetical protein n=1 Tax=Aerococcus viridans TaxID=1377 RepID=UPI00223B0A8A|nr:hypothetical protein [Aerococcus viridans]MCT1798471.1 hypothetical protein [Aerococcus viridans]